MYDYSLKIIITVYKVRSVFLDPDTILYYLTVDQNIFKLQLYNAHECNVHILSFNLRVFLSQVKERLSYYSSLIWTSLLFEGTISNWTVDSKAITWTDVGYSFVISTPIKQVNVLELIWSVSFAFGSCWCEPHHVVKGSLHTRETDDC